tara:strand:- start:234 stop:1160 length:927 start_codon:yes stop_codon:yes gene_type:complete
MIKKKILTIIFVLIVSSERLLADFKIIAKIDSEIITNYDLIQEINYLEILNPNLTNLNKNQKLEIAKNSLINEIIKKKEIEKFVDIKGNNQFIDEYLKNLFTKLDIKNEEEFQNKLKEKNIYNLSKIKDKINIELFWNDLIFSKFKDQVKIDKKNLISKIENTKNNKKKEFFLSEIVFFKKKDIDLNDYIKEIKLSINEIGFNNAANIYSVADSSKFGGKVGWISQDSLSKTIIENLALINIGEYTDVIKLGNNFLILKIEDIKIKEMKIDKEKEIQKLITIETNKQLNKFSKIYFDKSKINYSIDEK